MAEGNTVMSEEKQRSEGKPVPIPGFVLPAACMLMGLQSVAQIRPFPKRDAIDYYYGCSFCQFVSEHCDLDSPIL